MFGRDGFLLFVAVKKTISKKLTSFHFITHLRFTAHKKGAKSIFDRGRDFSDFVWFLQTFTLKNFMLKFAIR